MKKEAAHTDNIVRTREHQDLFLDLIRKLRVGGEVIFVPDVAQWCREKGISETDSRKPLRLILHDDTFSLLVRDELGKEDLEARIAEVWIRDQVTNVAKQEADLLDTVEKKLAFLLLDEYAILLPENQNDLILADQWAFTQMRQLGYLDT